MGNVERPVLCDLKHVRKAFRLPNGTSVTVLEDVSLEVRGEEILAVLGPSGCGKSTLMRILAGLIPADSGEVLYRGKPLAGLNPGVAIVFQSFALYPWLTVTGNITEPLLSRGLSRAEAQAVVDTVIHTVGLTGFEETYPRELSGGMRQRVGVARALAVKPEILCMDEPFSQVDALTAENLRGELVRLWSDRSSDPNTIFMVSHDVSEVVTMATRIVILATRPGRVRRIIENPLPYPRDYRSPRFQKLVDEIHAVITETEIPDRPAAAAPEEAATAWEALPDVGASEITGLLEVLDDRGGRENIFELGRDLGREFGSILAVVKAAELLDFVETPKQEVTLTETGTRFLRSDIPARKGLFSRQVRGLRVVTDVLALLSRAAGHEIDDDVVLSALAIRLPYEDAGRLFRTLVGWGRQADLFDYDPARGKLTSEVEGG